MSNPCRVVVVVVVGCFSSASRISAHREMLHWGGFQTGVLVVAVETTEIYKYTNTLLQKYINTQIENTQKLYKNSLMV